MGALATTPGDSAAAAGAVPGVVAARRQLARLYRWFPGQPTPHDHGLLPRLGLLRGPLHVDVHCRLDHSRHQGNGGSCHREGGGTTTARLSSSRRTGGGLIALGIRRLASWRPVPHCGLFHPPLPGFVGRIP